MEKSSHSKAPSPSTAPLRRAPDSRRKKPSRVPPFHPQTNGGGNPVCSQGNATYQQLGSRQQTLDQLPPTAADFSRGLTERENVDPYVVPSGRWTGPGGSSSQMAHAGSYVGGHLRSTSPHSVPLSRPPHAKGQAFYPSQGTQQYTAHHSAAFRGMGTHESLMSIPAHIPTDIDNEF